MSGSLPTVVGGGFLGKILTGLCRPWYYTLYPIVGQILDKIIPYCRNDMILSKKADFVRKREMLHENENFFDRNR